MKRLADWIDQNGYVVILVGMSLTTLALVWFVAVLTYALYKHM